jgi:hypothetical protein
MMSVLSNSVGKEVCALFGLDGQRVKRVEIVFQSGNVVLVNATMYAEKMDLHHLFEIVKRFKLVPEADGE